MRIPFALFLCFVCISCSTTNFYIVRHAEKEQATTMSSDVPLSETGMQRAAALKDVLLHEDIRRIYSTNYNRTISTAQPLSGATGLRIETYDPADSHFIEQLKNSKSGNILIVGHSNTVDDLVNGLTGKKLLQDLPDAQYGDLFIVSKQGKSYRYTKSKFGL